MTSWLDGDRALPGPCGLEGPTYGTVAHGLSPELILQAAPSGAPVRRMRRTLGAATQPPHLAGVRGGTAPLAGDAFGLYSPP